MANLKDTIVLGNLTVTGSVTASSILGSTSGATSADYPTGFASRPSSISWGTLAESASYVTRWDDPNGGSVAFGHSDGKTHMQIDGYFYQDEGGYRVLDDRNIAYNTVTPNGTATATSMVYVKTRMAIKGNGASYNEGLRILPASNGWSNIFFSADDTLHNTHTGGWLLGRRGAAGTHGAAGDFTIEHNGSSGFGLTLPANGSRPKWAGLELAYKSDCKNPADYYWANIKVSNSSNSSTSPTFAEVYSEYGHFEWLTASDSLYANKLYMYDRSSDMYIGDPDYGDSTPNYIYLTAHQGIELNIRDCTITFRQGSGTVALLSDYWADVQLSSTSSTSTTPRFLRAKIGNDKRAVTCDPRTTVTSTGNTDLVTGLPTGSTHLGLLTWDSEAGFLGIDGDNAIICTPGDKGIFNVSGFLFICDEDSTFSNSSYKAYVDSNGAWKTNSDIRLKTNINSYPSVLESIKELDVITYTYIDKTQEKRKATEAKLAEAQEILQRPLLSAKQAEEAQDTIKDCERILRRLDEKRNKMEIGLSAQQIEEKLPMPELFIAKNPDEQLGYKYTLSESKLVFAAIKAIQEQQTIIESQQKLIDNLTKEVAAIKQTIIERGDSNE